jgi:hypothetical protein
VQTPQPSVTPDEESLTAEAPTEESLTAEAPTPRKKIDFAAEYGYVIDDLRSMAIIAVLMLAVLIALSFAIG